MPPRCSAHVSYTKTVVHKYHKIYVNDQHHVQNMHLLCIY